MFVSYNLLLSVNYPVYTVQWFVKKSLNSEQSYAKATDS
jgi:hypothetical protein